MRFTHFRSAALAAAMASIGSAVAFPENVCGMPESQLESQTSQQIEDPSGSQQQQQMKPQSFIIKTAADNKLEIALGQLAQIKAENPQVRQFGQQLAQEHAKANQQLDTLAQKQGMPLHLEQFAQLTQASGPQFDQAYVRYLSQEGRQGLQHLQQIADQHPDQSIRQFARQQVTQMQQNLQQVQKVQTQVQAGGQIREPAGAEPNLQGPSPSAQNSQQQHYYSQLEQRAEGRHYPAGQQGAIIREQAGAQSQEQLQKQVQQLEQQLQQLQLQVQQLQRSQGQGGQPGHQAGGKMEMPSAREFVMTGAAYGKLCSALSQLAIERAQRPEVKQLAQQQLQAGQQASEQMQQLAREQGVPTSDVQQVRQLTQAFGQAFDQAYVSFIVDEHRRSLQELEKASQSSDSDIQQFAQAQLPAMKKHMEHAQRLQTQIQAGRNVNEPAGAAREGEYKDLRELLREE